MSTPRIWASLDPFFEPGAIVGRRVANAAFLTHLFAADPFDQYHFFLDRPAHIRSLRDALKRNAAEAVAAKCRILPRDQLPRMLADTAYHCVHQSDCISLLHVVSALRNRYSRAIFPVTGVTHSLSYAAYPAAFLNHLWPGTTPRDCVAASSQSGMRVVEEFYALLRERYGLDPERFPAPRVELMPLGVEPDMAPADPERRRALRESLGLGPDQVMLLVFGRLHPASKMDHLAVLRALSRCFQAGLDRKSIRLDLAGWAEDGEPFPKLAKGLAKAMGLQLTLHLRPKEERKIELFQAADIFLSPSDNPQETFGLTLLEAAAAGLPVLASDYDGYKDLVRHGETGFLVPTTGPAATHDLDAMALLVPEARYHLRMAQQTAVSVPDLAQRIQELAQDPGKRQAMGRAGRAMAEQFAWPRIIARWVALWDQLWKESAPEPAPLREIPHPLLLPYGRIFSHYPSSVLDPGLVLVWTAAGQALHRGQEHAVVHAGIEDLVQPDQLQALVILARKPRSVAELMERLGESFPDLDAEAACFLISWALKHDFLQPA